MQLALMFVNNPHRYLEGFCSRMLKAYILYVNVISNSFCHKTQQVTFSEYIQIIQ